MDDGGPSLPLGGGVEGVRAVGLTNADGSHAVLVRAGERPKAVLTVGTDARAGRLLVTALDDGVELRRDPEAAAQWIASGSVRTRAARVPAWANFIGLVLVVLVFALTVIGALTAASWLAEALTS